MIQLVGRDSLVPVGCAVCLILTTFAQGGAEGSLVTVGSPGDCNDREPPVVKSDPILNRTDPCYC